MSACQPIRTPVESSHGADRRIDRRKATRSALAFAARCGWSVATTVQLRKSDQLNRKTRNTVVRVVSMSPPGFQEYPDVVG